MASATSQVKLGDSSLENYLSSDQQKINPEKIRDLTNLIETLGGIEGRHALVPEKEPLLKLCSQQAQYTYPQLNPDFLQMHTSTQHKSLEMQVPRFSVYQFMLSNIFSLEFRVNRKMNDLAEDIRSLLSKLTKKKQPQEPDKYYGHIAVLNEKNPLPSLLSDPLLKGLDFAPYIKDRSEDSHKEYHFTDVPSSKGEEYLRLAPFSIWSQWQGIFPSEAREKIIEARKIFKKEELYLIAETKPQEWNMVKLAKDPILIGLKEDKCYFIHHFNTVPIEDYVIDEFISNSSE